MQRFYYPILTVIWIRLLYISATQWLRFQDLQYISASQDSCSSLQPHDKYAQIHATMVILKGTPGGVVSESLVVAVVEVQ